MSVGVGRGVAAAMVMAVLVALTSSAAASAAVPKDGYWSKDGLLTGEFPAIIGFHVRGGGTRIEQLDGAFFDGDPDPLECGAALENAGPVAIAADGSFSFNNGQVAISGSFTTSVRAEGTYSYVDRCNDAPRGPFAFHVTLATEAPPPPPDPGTPPPSPSGAPGCHGELTLGLVTVVAECLREEGGTYVLEGRARVNGIDLLPGTGGRVVFDPGRLSITATGSATVRLGPLTLYEGDFQWSAESPFTFRASRSARVGGLRVSGDVSGQWAPAGATLTVNLNLGGDFGSVTGRAELGATMDRGLQLDGLELRLEDGQLRLLRRLVLKELTLSYTRANNRWEGGVRLGLPALREVAAGLAIQNGRFASANVEVNNLNLYLGNVIFLQSLRGEVRRDPLLISGGAGFTAGPQFSVFGARVRTLAGDVDLTWEDGDSFDTWTLAGTVELASFRLGDASIVYRTGRSVDVEGQVSAELGPAGIEGGVEGWLEGFRDNLTWQFRGDVRVSVPLLSAGGEALISNRGIGACATKNFIVGSLTGGVSYRWGASSPRLLIGSCDFGDIEAQRSARSAQAGQLSLRLRGRRRGVVLAVRGAGGAPRVSLTGPGGLTLVGPPAGALRTPRSYYVESAQEQVTYIVLARPRPGRYVVSAQPGSVPLASLGRADALPRPRVRARVSGRGARRVLRWRLRRIPGQSVAFVERGPGLADTIAVTRRSRGRVRFRPSAGPGRRRRVVAVVRQGGLTRKQLTVARLRVRRGRVARARRVRVSRRGRRIAVRWRHPGGANAFDVYLSLRSGRRVLHAVGPRARRTRFGGVRPRDRGRVSVVARSAGNRTARPSRARFGPRRR